MITFKYACAMCHRPLTGGIDTWGDLDTQLCYEHRFTLEDEIEDGERAALLKRIDALIEELDDLHVLVAQTDGELFQAQRDLEALDKKRAARPIGVLL